MLDLDGQEYTLRTPQDNVVDAINYVNQYCVDNNIRNLQGEVVSLEIAPGSPAYLILLGFAYLVTLCQNLVYSLGRMLNIASCSNRQLVAIGEIIRMRRKGEIPTIIKGLVRASSDGDCQITTTLTARIRVGNNQVTFSPTFDVLVPQDSVRTIMLQAQSYGSYFIEANTITTFDSPPANFKNMTTLASTPGRPQETYPQFRRRVQLRQIAYSSIEKCIQALRDLPGIATANVFFNYESTSANIVGQTLEARQAMAFIQGYNPDIAKTIFSYLLCDMKPLPFSQAVTLNNGQVLSAYWDMPVFIPIYIDLWLKGNYSIVQQTAIVNAIQTLALEVEIADTVTVADVIRVCQRDVPSVIMAGVQLSYDQYTWSQVLTLGSNQLFDFTFGNVRINEV